MLSVILIALCFVGGALGDFNLCNKYDGPDHLMHLGVIDFATPLGNHTLDTFCVYLKDFYSSNIREENLRKPCVPIFKYLRQSRRFLQELCMKTHVFHETYKKHEECYKSIIPAYDGCVVNASDEGNHYFRVPRRWPKNETSVQNCIKSTRFMTCMADHIMKLCDPSSTATPKANRFYLEIIQATNLHRVYCERPYSFHLDFYLRMLIRDMRDEELHRLLKMQIISFQ